VPDLQAGEGAPVKFAELCFPPEGQVFACCGCDVDVELVAITERTDVLGLKSWTVFPCRCQNQLVDRVE
jgi:hypothetical protein